MKHAILVLAAALAAFIIPFAEPATAATGRAAWEGFTLTNGIRVWHRQDPLAATGAVRFVFEGAVGLPGTRPGTDETLFALLQTAGERVPRAELERILDEGAIRLDGSSGRDFSWFGVQAVAGETTRAVALAASLVRWPNLDDALFAETRTTLVGGLRWKDGQAFDALESALDADIFGRHGYAASTALTASNARLLRADDVRRHHRRLLREARLTIVSCGPLSLAAMRALLERELAIFPRQEPADKTPFAPFPAGRDTLLFFPHPAAGGAYCKGQFAAPAPGHPDYPAFLVASRIISEMLMDSIRTRSGLVYSVWASTPRREKASSASIVLYRCRDIAPALKLTARVLAAVASGVGRLGDGKLKADVPLAAVLPAAKNQLLTALYMQQMTTAEQVAGFASWLVLCGRGDAGERLADRILATNPDEIMSIVARYYRDFHWGLTK